MSRICLPWPYAAKAVIQHEHAGSQLNIWLTFRFTMDQTVKPANAKWIVFVDGAPKDVTVSVWQDAYTLLFTVPEIGERPDRVLVEYLGPDPSLRITWQKQWEPWGPILSLDITTP